MRAESSLFMQLVGRISWEAARKGKYAWINGFSLVFRRRKGANHLIVWEDEECQQKPLKVEQGVKGEDTMSENDGQQRSVKALLHC